MHTGKALVVTLLSGIILGAGCVTPPSTPESTLAPQAQVSPTLVPTATRSPETPTAVNTPATIASASASPSPLSAPLATSGPYLIYAQRIDAQVAIIIADADGRGRKVVALPIGARALNLPAATSPDGRWLAFYTGSAGQCAAEEQTGPFDLTLSLIDLSSGQTRLLTHLLSADFPDNFRTVADLLAAQGLTPEDGVDPFTLHDALACGIESLAWSPDGRYLAFAGQMDGPSSDVYVAALDGSIVKDLPRSPVPVIAWLGPSTYLVSDGREGIGSFNLRSIDIESGMIETLWKTAFRSPALDREHHLLAIAGYEALSQDTHPALYFVDWNEGSQRKIRFDTSPRPARTCRFTLRTASSSGPSNLPRPARKSIASSGVPTRPVCSSPLEPSCTPPTFWPEKPIR